jgi:hypothetical protein
MKKKFGWRATGTGVRMALIMILGGKFTKHASALTDAHLLYAKGVYTGESRHAATCAV